MFSSLSEPVDELLKVLDVITKNDLDLGQKRDVLDFNSNKSALLKDSLDKYYKQFLNFESKLHSYKFNEIVSLFEKVKQYHDSGELVGMRQSLFDLQLLLPVPKKIAIDFPRVPLPIKSEISADVQEIKKCFDAGCYRSAVILCGRILETALHRKYFEKTNNDILETNPSIGLGKLIAKLREHNFSFPPGLSEQIHLINKARISSVHKKSEVFLPSREQANAIILYSLDVLKKLF